MGNIVKIFQTGSK